MGGKAQKGEESASRKTLESRKQDEEGQAQISLAGQKTSGGGRKSLGQRGRGKKWRCARSAVEATKSSKADEERRNSFAGDSREIKEEVGEPF